MRMISSWTKPSVAILQQHRLRHRAGLDHLGLQQLRHGGAENILASGVGRSERVDRGGDPRGIETFVSCGPGGCHDAVHGLSRYRTPPTLSREHSRR